jgi:threonine dehydrogenase-like Zn-dependent dehydrogenase
VERKLLSAALPGSNAQFVKIPARFVYVLPDHVTFEQGTFVEPMACGVRAAELAEVLPDHHVLIVGLGPIGLFALQAMQAHGVKHIIAVDRNRERLAIAAELGAIPLHASEVDVKEEVRRLTSGVGVAVAVDAVGAGVTRTQCIECVAFGGKVILTGLHEAESSLPINHIIRSEIVCVGAFAYSSSNFKTALQWIADGRVTMKDEWVVKAPFEEACKWYDLLISDPGKVAKVLLYP